MNHNLDISLCVRLLHTWHVTPDTMHVTRHWSHVTTCCKDSAARPAPVTVAPRARTCNLWKHSLHVRTFTVLQSTYLLTSRQSSHLNKPSTLRWAAPGVGWLDLLLFLCTMGETRILTQFNPFILEYFLGRVTIIFFLVCKMCPFSHFSELFWVITIYRSGDTRQVPGQLLYVAFIMHLCHNSTRNIREMSKYKTLFHSYNPNISGNVPPH